MQYQFQAIFRILDIDSDEAVVAIDVEGIKTFLTSFYSPFSVQNNSSYGRLMIAVQFSALFFLISLCSTCSRSF
jgi:hypothetical protein